MGFFSWVTQDSKRSIPNSHSERSTFPVTMTDNKGNKWIEKDYDGYGEFEGKDFYELLAEMNGLESDRMKGIELSFGEDSNGNEWFKEGYVKEFLSPNLSEDPDWIWMNKHPEDCEHQGYFYSEDDEDL